MNGRVTQAEVDGLEDGLGQVLTALEIRLADEVFAETFPLVGNNFKSAWSNNVAAFRYLTTLRTAVVAGLATLSGQADYAVSDVANPIKTRLTSAGFNAGTNVVATTLNDQVQLVFTTLDTFTNAAVPIEENFGVPTLDLHLTDPGNAQTAANWAFNFTAGVDGTGFYLQTADSTFTLGTTTTAVSLNKAGRFAQLPYVITDLNTNRTNIGANFVIGLRDPDNSGKIRLDELAGNPDLLDATVTGTAKMDLILTSGPENLIALPQLRTELVFTWPYLNSQVVDPDDDNATFGAKPDLRLNNNSIQLASFFNSFIYRVLTGIHDATSPLDPLIDILTFPIPLLSDLGSEDVTALDIAGASESQVAAISGLAALNDLASLAIGFTTGPSVWVNMGSWIYGIDDLHTVALVDAQEALSAAPSQSVPADLTTFKSAANPISGLDLPLLEDGLVLADLLRGKPADLFRYISGEFELHDGFHAFYPVLGPIGITLGGEVGVRTQFGFGFDSQGIFDYFNAGPGADPDLVFNGFYALAVDEDDHPVTGITPSASFAVMAVRISSRAAPTMTRWRAAGAMT